MGLTSGMRLGYLEVLSKVGQGGMGEVYAARDTRLDRDVALKVLPADVLGDPDRRARFDREARVLASLNHPNIATLHGVETSAGQTILVMELVQGETMADRLHRGALSIADVARIFVQLAAALEAAHAAGIVHRDLKPANIKITPEGRVKVLDFGLARPAASATPGSDDGATVTAQQPLTQGVVVLGTAAYMSPEQARGLPVDRRADVWAFGATLYEALTGRRAFDGQTASEALAMVLEREPDWSALPASVPLVLRRLLARCLRKDPADRLHDIADARIELDDLLHESREGTGATTSVAAVAESASWRSRMVRAGLGLAGAVLAAIGLLAWDRSAASPRQTMRFQVPLPDGWYFRGVGSFGSPITISADGREVIFAAREGLKGDTKVQLFTHRVGEFGSTPIPGSEGARGPFISHDSRQLGFLVEDQVKIRTWQSEGNGGPGLEPVASRTVATVDVAFFGADFSRRGDPVYIGECTRGLRAAYSGGDARKATLSDVFEQEVRGQHQFPQELPDGKHILFTWWSPPESEIRLHSLDTGESRTLVAKASHGRYVPSGHIVFAWEGALYAVRFDLTRLEVVGEPVKVVDGVRWESWRGTAHYAVSDEGTLVYVPGKTIANREGPVWISRDGSSEPVLENQAGEAGGAVSPDGSRIAIVRTLNQVWTYEVARGVWRRLSQGKGPAMWPSWTPDGQRVVFQYAEPTEAASEPRGPFNLYWRLADGSGPQERLTKSGSHQQPVSISPDGRTLAFTQVELDLKPVNAEIWMLPLDGTRAPWQWLPGTRGVLHPVFSPDGKWIAYASHESGEWQVLVRPAAGTAPVEQVSIVNGWEPRWSADGREIYYRSIDGRTVFAATFQAGSALAIGRPRVLVEGNFRAGLPWGYAWHPSSDGQRLLMWSRGEVTSSPPMPYYHVVLNWHEELKRLVPIR